MCVRALCTPDLTLGAPYGIAITLELVQISFNVLQSNAFHCSVSFGNSLLLFRSS